MGISNRIRMMMKRRKIEKEVMKGKKLKKKNINLLLFVSNIKLKK
jgi:hypothetical protein